MASDLVERLRKPWDYTDGKREILCEEAAARIAALEAELAEARKALIETGRNLGAGLADNVSTAFLAHLPEEARLVRERLSAAEARAEKMKEALEPFKTAIEAVPIQGKKFVQVIMTGDEIAKIFAALGGEHG